MVSLACASPEDHVDAQSLHCRQRPHSLCADAGAGDHVDVCGPYCHQRTMWKPMTHAPSLRIQQSSPLREITTHSTQEVVCLPNVLV